jgi:mutator protein MutT
VQQIALAVVGDGGRWLVGQRAQDQTLGGLAEFPGGKVRLGESPQDAAVRECWEETGLAVEVTGRFAPREHEYAHGRLELHFFRCRPTGAGAPLPPFRWVETADLAALEFPAANRPILAELLRERAP